MNLCRYHLLKTVLAALILFTFGCGSAEKKQASFGNQNTMVAGDPALRERLAEDQSHGYALSTAPEGFFENSTSNNDDLSIASQIIGDLISPPKYRSMLTVRISCAIKDSVFPLVPRLKNVKWSFVDPFTPVKFKNGEVQTDAEGLARMSFYSTEVISGKLVDLSIGKYQKQVRLGSGPYAFEIGEDGCLHAR